MTLPRAARAERRLPIWKQKYQAKSTQMPLTLAAMSISPVLKSMLAKHLPATASIQLRTQGNCRCSQCGCQFISPWCFLIANQQTARIVLFSNLLGALFPVNGNPESDQFFNHSLKYISMWSSKGGGGPWVITVCRVFLQEHLWPPPHNPSLPPQLSYLSQICIMS